MRKILLLALLSMFIAAACSKSEETAPANPEASAASEASPAAGGGGEASPAASPAAP